MGAQGRATSSVDSRFPCLLPQDDLLTLGAQLFEEKLVAALKKSALDQDTLDTANTLDKINLNTKHTNTFMDALLTAEATPKTPGIILELEKHNQTLTDNGDVTFKSTGSPVLDLFDALGRDASGPRMEELLQGAWEVDSLASLKIIWNARSIHLGKGEQDCFYKACGWLAKNHPATLLLNLQWLVRSVIELKPEAAKDKAVMIEKEDATQTDLVRDLEILHGGSHGYFKDLLNLLVLAANSSLDVNDNPRKVLHARNPFSKKRRCPYPPVTDTKRGKAGSGSPLRSVEECKQLAKEDKHRRESESQSRAVKNLQAPFYRYLHATVARMLADQLKIDLDRLKSGKREQTEKITLAAKWAPSLQGFHDKHTLIASSIAEILFPVTYFDPQEDRTTYLKLAREAYRSKYLTPLRAHLDVIERKITRELFGEIDYARIPSLAMDMHKNLFIRKDYEHFAKYIESVAAGKAKISGAILTPASIVYEIMSSQQSILSHNKAQSVKQILEEKRREILGKTSDGQWKTLVERIQQSGKLASTIAVCDVSGSMYSPSFNDGTAPIHSAIGLSLLVAEVTAPPFGGSIITFSANPVVEPISNAAPLSRRVADLIKLDWGMNTDFVAVFERLILPMAIKHKIPADEMVKQVIVFSDMQFDAAQNVYPGHEPERWQTSFDSIKRKFAEAGYELPLLVFWNLASHAHGSTAALPVSKNEDNTMLVSGYSQAMLKAFLDNGGFEAEEEEEDAETDDGGGSEGSDADLEQVQLDSEGDVVVKEAAQAPQKKDKDKGKAKRALNPEAGMRKAISHEAYGMLKVFD